jgi:hypothetical protein
MRVKLAVHVLNSKVQNDMAKYDNDATESTQKYILNCETLWNVFNDTKPLTSLEDSRIKALDNVLQFFNNWSDELASIFKTKSEQFIQAIFNQEAYVTIMCFSVGSCYNHVILLVGKQCLIYR